MPSPDGNPVYGDVLLHCRWVREEGALWMGRFHHPVMVIAPPSGLLDCGMGVIIAGPDAGEAITLAIYDHITVWIRDDGTDVWFDRREKRGK